VLTWVASPPSWPVDDNFGIVNWNQENFYNDRGTWTWKLIESEFATTWQDVGSRYVLFLRCSIWNTFCDRILTCCKFPSVEVECFSFPSFSLTKEDTGLALLTSLIRPGPPVTSTSFTFPGIADLGLAGFSLIYVICNRERDEQSNENDREMLLPESDSHLRLA